MTRLLLKKKSLKVSKNQVKRYSIFNFKTPFVISVTLMLFSINTLFLAGFISQEFSYVKTITTYLLYGFFGLFFLHIFKNIKNEISNHKLNYMFATSFIGNLLINSFFSLLSFLIIISISYLYILPNSSLDTGLSLESQEINLRDYYIFIAASSSAFILVVDKFVKFKISKYIFFLLFIIFSIFFPFLKSDVESTPVSNVEDANFIDSRLSCDKNATLDKAKLCTAIVITDSGSHGTGFSFRDGFIVTNRHVIEDSKSLITYYDDREYELSIWNYSNDYDVAILKLPDDLSTYTCNWFDSDKLNIAEDLYAFGWPIQPLGDSTVTKGIYSRTIVDENDANYIQTDASLNAGNSGGPLVNECGVTGLVTSKNYWVDVELPAEGNGFALSSKFLQPIIEDLYQKGGLGKKAPMSSKSFIKDDYESSEPYYLDVSSIKRYLSELYDVRRSWEPVSGVDRSKYDRLIDLFNRQIDFCNHLVNKLADGKAPSNDDLIMWDSVVEMSKESYNLSQELLNSMGY